MTSSLFSVPGLSLLHPIGPEKKRSAGEYFIELTLHRGNDEITIKIAAG